jgi:hypothetical protein
LRQNQGATGASLDAIASAPVEAPAAKHDVDVARRPSHLRPRTSLRRCSRGESSEPSEDLSVRRAVALIGSRRALCGATHEALSDRFASDAITL